MKVKSLFCMAGLLTTTVQASAQKELINNDWKFCKADIVSIDSLKTLNSWTNVTLPHTWNAIDGQDGGEGKHDHPIYYRGIGWYTRDIHFDKKDAKKQIYLRLGAANYDTEVFLNNRSVGTHRGGYTAFACDLTPFIRYGEKNTLAIRVSNAKDLPIPPLHADFTFYGGLPRNAELYKENKLHFTHEDYGSCGIYIKPEQVSHASANVQITAKVRNSSTKKQKAHLRFVIRNREGEVVRETVQTEEIESGKTRPVTARLALDRPHLWDGKNDPYLYRTEVTLSCGKEVTDFETQPLGLRYYHIDPDKGFFLNGKPYPLRGVCMHEGHQDKGNALSDADRKQDLDLVDEIGANYMRIAHYQHGDFTYNYLDSLGIVCWAEIPLIDKTLTTKEFETNCETVLKSLIRQLYNHPSVIVWGMCNEIHFHSGKIDPKPLITHLNDLAHLEDPTRKTVLAAMNWEKPVNYVPDAYSINPYFGWYYNKAEEIGPALDRLHKKHPNTCLGISEYGAGAHPYQHQEGLYLPATTGHWHPENIQAHVHEKHLKAINERPYLWSTSVWAMFDFASDGRHEGNQPGINDKGLVTYDRRIKKDAFYLYKANWNPEPTVHLCNQRFIKRNDSTTTVKIYANCNDVKLTVNKQEIPLVKGDCATYTAANVSLKEGRNDIVATGSKDGKTMKDTAVWYYVPDNRK